MPWRGKSFLEVRPSSFGARNVHSLWLKVCEYFLQFVFFFSHFFCLLPQAEFSLKHFWCLICIFLQLAELHADTGRLLLLLLPGKWHVKHSEMVAKWVGWAVGRGCWKGWTVEWLNGWVGCYTLVHLQRKVQAGFLFLVLFSADGWLSVCSLSCDHPTSFQLRFFGLDKVSSGNTNSHAAPQQHQEQHQQQHLLPVNMENATPLCPHTPITLIPPMMLVFFVRFSAKFVPALFALAFC